MFEDVLAWISPRSAMQRAAWRAAWEETKAHSERRYEGADRGRLNKDWRASNGSADSELLWDLATLRARSRQMIRDNKYARTGLKNLTAWIVGTGIKARALHADPKVAAMAQAHWDTWADGPVDGRQNFYGVQKTAVSAMISDGDSLLQWRPLGRVPDSLVSVLEGDYLNSTLNQRLSTGGRIVSGVQFDANGFRAGYNLFAEHPGDQMTGVLNTSSLVPAADVDHLFETLRPGQTRGVPWFHAALTDLRDIKDLEQSLRIKKRVEACLALFRKPGDQNVSPLGNQEKVGPGTKWETLSPGMIATLNPGEDVTVVNPSSNGDGDAFRREQLMAIAASFGLPYHIFTGDVSQANYSSLRAAITVFFMLLDEWEQLTVVPLICAPAFIRRMRVAALQLNEPRLLEVKPHWTGAPRPWVDPLKDMTAQVMEIRAGLSGLPEALASRGRDWRTAFAEQAQVNALIDQLGLAFDTDPRRLNGLGALQPTAGYVLPKAQQTGATGKDSSAEANTGVGADTSANLDD